MMPDVVALLTELINCPSITPHDADCQAILKKYLTALDFEITDLPAGPVANFWAKRGTKAPLFVFAGHTDVVTPGDSASWRFPPFKATLHDGVIYGRGAQDMKGGLAAMLVATQRFIKDYPNHAGSIGFLITSGEEGNDYLKGTPVVMDYLKSQNQKIDWCVVGEPSSASLAGDTIRPGRRGSLHAHVTLFGKQGHVAFPHLAQNPIHIAMNALNQLVDTEWDKGSDDFPPTSLQITSIESGVMGENKNMIPEKLTLQFNFRYSVLSSEDALKTRVESLLQQTGLAFELTWELSGKPFLTPKGRLTTAANQAIHTVMGFNPTFSTAGGTSDARFIAPSGAEVIELGVTNSRIHQVDEAVSVKELNELTEIYYQLLVNLFNP